MKQSILVSALCVAVLVAPSEQARGESGEGSAEWSIEASYLDACCCAPSCPCLFGSAPTLGYCEGVTLIDIDEAHFGGVGLDGVKVLAVYRGGTWIKFYVDDTATAEQTEAVVEFLPTFEGFFAVENVVEVENVPISVERTERTIKVSTPNTTAHIEMMVGKNGEAIKIANLPGPTFPAPPYIDHTQYKTILLQHTSDDQSYEYTGTNGFTARIDVDSGGTH